MVGEKVLGHLRDTIGLESLGDGVLAILLREFPICRYPVGAVSFRDRTY